ncbi:hypothetical protein [Deinococcus sp.]|uniref:hypothetical protein n=1 Tax=Deinococcus sp. TaxID=47478 RepID=UPI003B5CA7F2
MKLTVDLSPEQVAFLDRYQQAHNLNSRRAALGQLLRQLEEREMEAAYRAAGAEWQGSEDARLWEQVSGEGL